MNETSRIIADNLATAQTPCVTSSFQAECGVLALNAAGPFQGGGEVADVEVPHMSRAGGRTLPPPVFDPGMGSGERGIEGKQRGAQGDHLTPCLGRHNRHGGHEPQEQGRGIGQALEQAKFTRLQPEAVLGDKCQAQRRRRDGGDRYHGCR